VSGFLTTGKLALRLGVQEHHIRTLARLGRIPFALAGVYRVFTESDLSQIRAACVQAGYLQSDAEPEKGEVVSVA
jgi:DNA-binding transcriptional MerR regulator